MNNKEWKRIIPGLAISVISLAVVFYVIDPAEFLNAVRLADYRIVALGFGVTLVWLMVRAMVWRTLLQEKATFKQTFLTVNEGYLLNNILPFRLGEVGRSFLLGRKTGLAFWQVFSTVLIERILDLAFAAGLLLVTLPFVVGATWAREGAILVGLVVAAGLVGIWLLAHFRQQAFTLIERLAQRWPWLLRLLGSRMNAFFDGLEAVHDLGRFARVVGWMLLNWLVAIGQYYMLMRAFFPEAKFLWAAFSLGTAALGLAVPAAPGSIGTMEGTLMGGLALFDLNPSTAFAFAITTHVINYLITTPIGVYALAQDGESLTSLYHKVRRIPAEPERAEQGPAEQVLAEQAPEPAASDPARPAR